MINCKLNGKETSALWDTGSQISIISSDFLKRHFPYMQSKSLEEILETSLVELHAVNNSPIPYSGFVELGFELTASHESDNSLLLNVPFLISDCTIANPIIGYNVIEEIIRKPRQNHGAKQLRKRD